MFLLGLTSPSPAQVTAAAFHGTLIRPKIAVPVTVVLSPQSTSDDVGAGNGAAYTPTSGFSVGNNLGGDQYGGMRFPNTSIPAGATIISAVLSAYYLNGMGTGVTQVLVYGQKSISPTPFTNDFSNLTGRPKTTASTVWSIPYASTYDTKVSPDLKSIIQEIVNLPGWTSGMNMVLLFNNNASWQQSCYLYGYTTDHIATLTIKYQ
jgi:hypothetical protein